MQLGINVACVVLLIDVAAGVRHHMCHPAPSSSCPLVLFLSCPIVVRAASQSKWHCRHGWMSTPSSCVPLLQGSTWLDVLLLSCPIVARAASQWTWCRPHGWMLTSASCVPSLPGWPRSRGGSQCGRGEEPHPSSLTWRHRRCGGLYCLL